MAQTQDDFTKALAALTSLDPRLAPVAETVGPLPLRAIPSGLRGVAGIVVAQQVSRASAAAIVSRLEALVDLDDALALASASDETLRRAGLSRPKVRTLRALGAAVASGALDFMRIAQAEPEAAIAELVAVSGIGPWTAQCYLLFSLRHQDIFPAGDLALQVAVADALGMSERPTAKSLAAAAAAWHPYRSIAARLFWAHYANGRRC